MTHEATHERSDRVDSINDHLRGDKFIWTSELKKQQ